MTRRSRRALCGVLLFATTTPAWAHHGQDFLLVESPTVPHPGDAYLLANLGVALADSDEQAGFEPALLVGIAPRFAFELHGHTEKLAGEPWRYEATAPSVHVLLTDPERHDGLQSGLSAEYEIAREGGGDTLEVRWSVQHAAPRYKAGANLVYRHEEGGTGHFGAVIGTHWRVAPRVALGAEAQGDFDRAEGTEAIASAHWECDEAWSLKFGLGGQRTDDGRWVPLARFGLVLRLRD